MIHVDDCWAIERNRGLYSVTRLTHFLHLVSSVGTFHSKGRGVDGYGRLALDSRGPGSASPMGSSDIGGCVGTGVRYVLYVHVGSGGYYDIRFAKKSK